MNRSKSQYSTTAERQPRAVGIDQESKRTTITTENELCKSLVSTVKNSHLACEVTREPIEEQRNPQTAEHLEVLSSDVRGRSAAKDDPLTFAGMLKNATSYMLNPLDPIIRRYLGCSLFSFEGSIPS